jgi:hypothetical protein
MSLVRHTRRFARRAPLALALAVLAAAAACASRDQQAATPSDPAQPAGQTAAEASAPVAAPETPAGEAPATPAAAPGDPSPSASQPAGSAPSARQAAGPAAAPGYRRVELPGGEGRPFPYTVDIPEGWQIHQPEGTASIFFGPAGSKPEEDPRMVFVRISPASVADPEATVASIRASDAADPKWSAPLVEVREVNGVKGVLVQMDSGEGEAARSTLALKLPLPKTSVDFMASAPQGEFQKLRPDYERILFSVRPVP